MAQFQVPQFIETEDTVVGPFSIKQFFIVGAAVVVSALAYFVVQTWLFVIITIILVGGSIALSFIKIEGRPLFKVIASAGRFYWSPQTYVWQADHVAGKTGGGYKKESGIPLEDIFSRMALRKRAEGSTLDTILSESPLHKSWEGLQSGTTLDKKTSDRQFLDRKMSERYEIFRRLTGDRSAARRVDYR